MPVSFECCFTKIINSDLACKVNTSEDGVGLLPDAEDGVGLLPDASESCVQENSTQREWQYLSSRIK
jgi:hypothetical protein